MILHGDAKIWILSSSGENVFSSRDDKMHIFKPPCNFLFIDSMQKAVNVNDVSDIFTVRYGKYATGYFLVKHSHLYNKTIYGLNAMTC